MSGKEGSSPYQERPLEALDADQLRHELLTLRYQYTTLQNEYEIFKLSSERETNSLQNKYDKSMNELDRALSDTKLLYEENMKLKDSLKSKSDNSSEESKLVTSLQRQVGELKDELDKRDQKIEQLKHETASIRKEAESSVKSLELELETSQKLLNKHKAHVDEQYKEIQELKLDIEAKDAQISKLQNGQLSDAHQNFSTQDLHEITILNKTLKEQLSYTKELEDMNLKQATELKKLKQLKDVQTFSKHENHGSQPSFNDVEQLKQKIESLEIENLSLQEKMTEWGIDKLDPRFDGPNAVIEEISLLQRENTFLIDTNAKLQKDFNQMCMLNDEMAIERNQLLDLNKDYETSILNLKRLNHELEQQKLLSFEECKILRQELEQLEFIGEGNSEKCTNPENIKTHDIIDGYKNQTEDLTNELKRLNEEFSKSDDRLKKRRKLTHNLSVTYSQRLNDLVLKNKELEKQLQIVKNHANTLEQKLADLSNIKEKKIRILQLRNNPLLKEHYIRKEKLKLLEQENAELLSKLKPTESVPKSVYDRISFDMKQLENDIYNSNKKTTRLKEMFNKKSLEFIEAVNSLLGFKLEFLSHGKVKLICCYQPTKYLIADLKSNTLKSDLANIIPDWDELFQTYVAEKGEIPLFLSYVKIRLWELAY